MDKFDPKTLHIVNQRVKGLLLAGLFAHAQAQFGGKAIGQNLSGAVGNRPQQGVAPKANALLGLLGHQQRRQALQQRLGQSGKPAGIELVRQRNREQLSRVNRLRGARQQFQAQAFGQLRHHRRAGRKTKVGQQGGDVHRVAKALPPQLQTQAQSLIGFKRRNKRFCFGHRHLNRGRGRAHPVQHMNQPQMAFCQLGMGIEFRQQGGEVVRRAHKALM